MGATLFWLQANGLLPGRARACFLVDYMAALMIGERSFTDATSAASSGLFAVSGTVPSSRRWACPSAYLPTSAALANRKVV